MQGKIGPVLLFLTVVFCILLLMGSCGEIPGLNETTSIPSGENETLNFDI